MTDFVFFYKLGKHSFPQIFIFYIFAPERGATKIDI